MIITLRLEEVKWRALTIYLNNGSATHMQATDSVQQTFDLRSEEASITVGLSHFRCIYACACVDLEIFNSSRACYFYISGTHELRLYEIDCDCCWAGVDFSPHQRKYLLGPTLMGGGNLSSNWEQLIARKMKSEGPAHEDITPNKTHARLDHKGQDGWSYHRRNRQLGRIR